MKNLLFSIFLILVSTQIIFASSFYNENGVKLDHILAKEKTFFIPNLNRNVVIWKSTFELTNNSKKSIAIRIPCYLRYAYSYLNPAEISTVQDYVPEFKLSDVYKNYVSEKPIMVDAKKTIISERYFATMDDVDLRTATVNWDFKYSFWY